MNVSNIVASVPLRHINDEMYSLYRGDGFNGGHMTHSHLWHCIIRSIYKLRLRALCTCKYHIDIFKGPISDVEPHLFSFSLVLIDRTSDMGPARKRIETRVSNHFKSHFLSALSGVGCHFVHIIESQQFHSDWPIDFQFLSR